MTHIEISRSAINHNLATYKSIIGNRILAPVVKSNAYGHGLREISKLCQENQNVDWLSVVNLSEALALRAYGFTKPVLVLNYIDTDIEKAVNQKFYFVTDSLDTIAQLNTVAKKKNCTFEVHLKIDTGLSRFGIYPDDIPAIVNALHTYPHVRITGIATHFASSQHQDQAFTFAQVERFKQAIELLKQSGITPHYVHTANSAATLVLDLPWCTVFRVGIGMYGYWSSAITKQRALEKFPTMTVKPILTWKTKILSTKWVPENCPIGYDSTATTSRRCERTSWPAASRSFCSRNRNASARSSSALSIGMRLTACT